MKKHIPENGDIIKIIPMIEDNNEIMKAIKKKEN